MEPFFKFIQEHASVFFLIIDQGGGILETNAYTSEVVGMELVGKSYKDVFVDFAMSLDLNELSKDPQKTHLLNVNTFLGVPQTFYFQFLQLDDEILALGKLDFKELELLRNQLLSANSELGNLTRELQKTNAELKKLNQLKNQFLGMAAHDLRKPTSLILNYSEFLEDELGTNLSEEQSRFLDIILSSAEYMGKIIDDFLDIALIESGRFELSLQPATLDSVLDGCLPLARYQATKRNITLQIIIDEELPIMFIDRSKIEQVINNLISNAIEHSENDTTVEIQITRDAERVLIAVKDKGEGIPEEVKAKLFQPFGRGGIRKKSGKMSIGLGLAIARKIVELHSGKIWVEFEVGSGSEFFVALPV